jgi:hypothetical protein
VRSVEADDWSLELIKRVTAAEAAGSGAQLAVCYWTCRAGLPGEVRRSRESEVSLAVVVLTLSFPKTPSRGSWGRWGRRRKRVSIFSPNVF